MEILREQQLTLQLASEQQEIATSLEADRANRQIPDIADLKSGPERKQGGG